MIINNMIQQFIYLFSLVVLVECDGIYVENDYDEIFVLKVGKLFTNHMKYRCKVSNV